MVVDGVMYTASAWSKVQALDAATGKLLWQFDPQVPGRIAIHTCCDLVNRGVAVWKGRVYVGTVDGRLIAIDARTGKQAWSVVTVDRAKPYTITGAPLVAKDKVIIGNGGAEFGVRGYVSAYDAATGRQLWRFYTVPGDPALGFESEALRDAAKTWSGEWWKDGGGGTVWNSLSYDPDLGLLYFGTGNAAPWGRKGGGDSLFAASIVAVRIATGAYVWHYQTTPGDVWDFDADANLSLADLSIGGQPRKVLMQAGKNGFVYVLDRRTGEFLSAKNFVPVNWTSGIDARTGRPAINPQAVYAQTGQVWVSQPGAVGAHSWHPSSFSPDTGLFYIPAQEAPFPFLRDKDFQRIDLGKNVELDMAATSLPADRKVQARALATLHGYLVAWDPVQQREVWRVDHLGPWNGGVLSTAGNLVFQGTAAGDLVAYRANDGRKLWSYPAQTGVVAAPMTFAVSGRQYVAVMAGWGGVYPLVAGELAYKSGRVLNRSRILAFALDATAHLPPMREESLPARPASFPEPDPLLVSEGAQQFSRHCADCHGDGAVSGGLVPDLRYSNALRDEKFWNAVINDGVLTAAGMVAFRSELSSHQQAAVRAFLMHRANQIEPVKP